MSAAERARAVVEAAIAETLTWATPMHPGVGAFIDSRDAFILEALGRLDEPDLDNDEPVAPGVSAAVDPDVDPDDPDDEVFCPRCWAGADSDEHHERCVVTGHAHDGEPAPDPGPHHKCAEHAAVLTRQRDEARLDRDDLLEDRATLRAACIETAGAAAALADNSVEGHARAARTAAAKAKTVIADLHDLADRLSGYDHSEHRTPMGITSPKDYEAGIRVSALEIRAIAGPRP